MDNNNYSYEYGLSPKDKKALKDLVISAKAYDFNPCLVNSVHLSKKCLLMIKILKHQNKLLKGTYDD